MTWQQISGFSPRANIALVLVMITVTDSARVGLFPLPAPSHVSPMVLMGKELVKKGHEVFMILPSTYPGLEMFEKEPLTILTSHHPEPDLFSHDLSDVLKTLFKLTPYEQFKSTVPGTEGSCSNLLSDQKLYEQLNSLDIDLFVMDGIPHVHCFYIVPYRLGKPFATFVTTVAPAWYRNPSLPSFMPLQWGNPYTPEMNFFERIDNFYKMLLMAWFPPPPVNRKDWAGMYAPERPPLSLNDIMRKSSLWLIDHDPVTDYPRAVMANEVFIGGLTTKPAAPLPADLEKILNSAAHGVIIMSFGSMMPDINSDRFMAVFQRIKQVVIWRHTSEYKGVVPVPPNVHLVKWMPQADLLGHKNTKLFITHGGANGQFESVYHGVPMLAFPAFAEQAYNAKRIEYHGFGKSLDIITFTEEELQENIHQIINNPSYRQNVQHASRTYRDKPMRPLETAIYWLEHVMKCGDKHLKSYALEMPWYTYAMLDILAFFVILIVTFIAALICLCCYLKGKFLSGKPNKKKVQ